MKIPRHRNPYNLAEITRHPARLRRVALLCAVAAASPLTWAGTDNWTDGSSLWSIGGSWSLGHVPAAGDVANLIETDSTTRIVTYDASATSGAGFATLTVDSTGSGFMTVAQTGGVLNVTGGDYVGYAGTGAFTQSGGTHTAGTIFVGESAGSSGNYSLSGSGVLSDTEADVGDNGTGTFTQNGGTHNDDGYLFVGYHTTASGSYALGGSGVLATANEFVGYNGVGAFTQSGGTHTISGSLILGNGAKSNGTSQGGYSLSGNGVLTTAYEEVGNAGIGTFTQSGGTNAVNGEFDIAGSAGSSGTYSLSGTGIFTSSSAYIGGNSNSNGAGGLGGLNISGGSMTVSSTLKIWNTNSTALNLSGGTLSVGSLDTSGNPSRFNWTGGTLNYNSSNLIIDPSGPLGSSLSLTNGQTLNANFGETIGKTAAASVTQFGGVQYTDGLVIGANSGASGALTLSGGHLTSFNELLGSGGGIGSITQTGGVNTVQTNIDLGESNLSTGSYSLSGSGVLTAQEETIGFNGNGIFTQTGGTNVTNVVDFAGDAGSSGTYTLSGNGVFNVTDSVYIGGNSNTAGGSGILNVSGGTMSVTNTLKILDHGNSALNLSGGTLSVGSLDTSGNPSRFNWTGGTLDITSSQNLLIGVNQGAAGPLGSSLTLQSGQTLIAGASYELVASINSGSLTASFQNNGANNTNTLVVESQGGSASYTLGGNGALTATAELIGNGYGSGSFVQNGGTNSTKTLQLLPSSPSGTASYTLNAGTLISQTSQIYVLTANGGTPETNQTSIFNQYGGVHQTQSLVLQEYQANQPNYLAYNLYAGTLNAAVEQIQAVNGDGGFYQNGGSNNPTTLFLGSTNINYVSEMYSLYGAYTLVNGNLNSGTTYVGYTGSGYFQQTGGTHTAQSLYLAGATNQSNVPSSGTYILSGGVLSTQLQIVGEAGNGTFIQNGGSNIITNSLWVGDSNTGNGVFNLAGGTLTANQEFVGSGGGGRGVFQQSGGVNNATQLYLSSGGSNFATAGTYLLSGGALNAGGESIGYTDWGIFLQSGGTHTVSGIIDIGSSGSSGTLTLNGANSLLTVQGDVDLQSNGGSGVLNVQGGTMTVGGTLSIAYASNSVNLSGGTLSVGSLNTNSNPGSFNWTAGTFAVTGSNGLTLGSGGPLISTTVGDSQTLNVTNTLTVTSGGSVNLSGGTVNANAIQLGAGGALNWSSGNLNYQNFNMSGGALTVTGVQENISSSFIQSGGTHTVNSAAFDIGNSSGSSGTYSLSGNGIFTVHGSVYVGGGSSSAGGLGVLNISGGTMAVNNTLKIWNTTNATAVNLSGGILFVDSIDTSGNPSGFNWTAGTLNVTGTNGLYFDSGQPLGSSFSLTNGQTLNVSNSEYVGYSNTASFTQAGGTHTATSLYLGANSGSAGSYSLSGGVLSAFNVYIGSSGTGTFSQSGGRNSISDLSIGALPGSTGNYSLSGNGVLTTTDEAIVGVRGSGTFTQIGGTHTANVLVIGGFSGASGSYSLGGNGILSASTYGEVVGAQGLGTFIQIAGTNSSVSLWLAENGGSGSYTLSGNGVLAVGDEYVGDVGPGTAVFLQSGGTHSVANGLYLGYSSRSSGTYSLSGSGILNVATSAYIGGSTSAAGGLGVLNISGGTMTVANTLKIWSSTNANAVNVSGGVLTAAATSNDALFNQTGGIANLGTLTGTGSVNIGGGTGSAVMNVTSLSQSAVTVSAGGAVAIGATSVYNNSGSNGPVVTSGGLASPIYISGTLSINSGARVAFNPSKPGAAQTNSIGTLSIGANSALDIGNHTVVVQNVPNEATINTYIHNGYNNQFFNGTSTNGGAINSAVATNDNTGLTAIAYGNSNDFSFPGSQSPYAATNGGTLTGNQVIIKPALVGDLLLRGTVGPVELGLLLDSYGTTSYDGTHINTWAYGNIDYSADGLVGPADLGLLLNSYGHSASSFVSPAARAAALKMSVHVNSLSAAPAIANNSIELDVNVVTGDISINGNNATNVSQLVIDSNGSGLVGNTTFSNAFNALFPASGVNSNASINPFNSFTNGSLVNGVTDIGDIYNVSANTGDLTFQFQEKFARSSLVNGTIVYVGLPEPTTLGLIGVAGAGLLARRRRKGTQD